MVGISILLAQSLPHWPRLLTFRSEATTDENEPRLGDVLESLVEVVAIEVENGGTGWELELSKRKGEAERAEKDS